MIQLKHYLKLTACLTGMYLSCMVPAIGQSDFSYAAGKLPDSKNSAFTSSRNEAIEKKALFSVLKELNKVKGVYFLYSEENLGTRLVNDEKMYRRKRKKYLHIYCAIPG